MYIYGPLVECTVVLDKAAFGIWYGQLVRNGGVALIVILHVSVSDGHWS